jgi:glycosyltransferase involved in cell wall biosynthesis
MAERQGVLRVGKKLPLRMTRARLRPLPVSTAADASFKSIAVCTVGELFGGVERHVLEMASSLQARGISTLFVLFHDGELAAQARQRGIEVVILPDSNHLLFSSSRKLARILERRNMRIVHAHGYKAMVFCAMARRLHPFALVKTEHGLPEKTPGKPIEALRSYFYHLFDAAATRLSNATVCYVTTELLAQHSGGSTRRARLVPNGISGMDRRNLPLPREFGSGRFKLAAVGRLDPVKALHIAIDALLAQGMPRNVELYLAGTGPCEGALRARAKASGLSERVHFLGFRRDAHSIIAHCDVLLMPSLHEGLPYTLLEAMALGTPVIASRVGGLAEVLENEVTGLLVAPRDAGAMAVAIRRLYDDHSLRMRLGEAALRVQQTRYSLDAMTKGYLQVYSELQREMY